LRRELAAVIGVLIVGSVHRCDKISNMNAELEQYISEEEAEFYFAITKSDQFELDPREPPSLAIKALINAEALLRKYHPELFPPTDDGDNAPKS
jgi:hypothetical protein